MDLLQNAKFECRSGDDDQGRLFWFEFFRIFPKKERAVFHWQAGANLSCSVCREGNNSAHDTFALCSSRNLRNLPFVLHLI
jgi:hypothetical protein